MFCFVFIPVGENTAWSSDAMALQIGQLHSEYLERNGEKGHINAQEIYSHCWKCHSTVNRHS